jgi:hypothetical protein
MAFLRHLRGPLLAAYLYLAHVIGSPGDWLMTPTGANGQPAAATYYRSDDGTHQALGVAVLSRHWFTPSRGAGRAQGDPEAGAYRGNPLWMGPAHTSGRIAHINRKDVGRVVVVVVVAVPASWSSVS